MGLSPLLIEDFSGGWNVRDAWSEVGDNESPDCLNITLDERGGIVKRLGLTKYNATQLGTDGFENLFYWQTLQYLIAQQGTTLYYSDGSGTWTTTTKTFTTSARVAMADFNGALVVAHPVDGVFYTTNGTTWNTGSTTVKGNCIAVWQNKCWVGGVTLYPSRVYYCVAGLVSDWVGAGSGNVDLREKDDAMIRAVGVGEGMDIAGRGGLFVFKDESCYRIHDSSTGAYSTVNSEYGAAGPLAVCSTLGATGAISRKGIIVLRGDGSSMDIVSQKINPLFSPTQMAFGYASGMCAGIYRDRMVFSLPRFGSTVNNLTLEFHPTVGWIVAHSFGAASFASFNKNTQKLYSADPSTGYAFEVFKGGSDNGAAIASRFQTRWFEPVAGYKCRYRAMTVNGRGNFNLYTKRDYSLGEGDLQSISIVGSSGIWGTGTWGTMIWGPDTYQDYQRFYSLGVGRAISFELSESGTSSATSPKLLDDGTADEVGAWACYGLHVDLVRLGYA